MDLYWGGSGPSGAEFDDAMAKVVASAFGAEVQLDRTAAPIGVCRRGGGEARVLSTADLDVVFDGYVHGIGRPLEDFLPALAQRVIAGEPLVRGAETGVFNVVVHRRSDGAVFLANDPGGLLPLYFAFDGRSLRWSSHLHLAAKAMSRPADDIGVVCKVAFGFTFGSRTVYQGIEQLNPGERVSWDPRRERLDRSYPDVYYSQYREHRPDDADAMWAGLLDAARPLAPAGESIGLMLSEGFDSRLIGGALRAVGASVSPFTHGTPETRGARITREVCEALGSEWVFDPMEDGYPSDLGAVRDQLLLSDNLNVPYWIYGSRHFSKSEVAAVTTGYALDTTIGGHAFYLTKASDRRRVAQRYEEIARQGVGLLSDRYVESLSDSLLATARTPDLASAAQRVKRFLAEDVAAELLTCLDDLPAVIDAELSRIRASGSPLSSQVLQRFFLENRVRKYSFGQELTLRINNRLVVPSYEPAFMRVASEVHPRQRIHHLAYIQLMRRHLPRLAAIENGGFGLPITRPRVVIETSRFVLKRQENKRIAAFLADRGASSASWYRGVNFAEKSVRQSKRFAIEDLLEADGGVLNRETTLRQVNKVRDYQVRVAVPGLYLGIELAEIFRAR